MLYYHNLRKAFGYPFEPSGIMYSNIIQMKSELENIGICEIEVIRDNRLKWLKPHNYKDIIYALRNKLITTWGSDLPDATRTSIAHKLENWLIDHKISMEREFQLTAYFELHCFQKN
jgi:hypothetical protein